LIKGMGFIGLCRPDLRGRYSPGVLRISKKPLRETEAVWEKGPDPEKRISEPYLTRWVPS